MSRRAVLTPRVAALALVVVLLLVLPAFGSEFFVTFVVTQTLILGLIAATIVLLTSYGGMISLAQLLLSGVAGFMFGNAALESGARGMNLGWPTWVAVIFALAGTTALAFLLGALASRTTGIYFLMLTLVYGVIGTAVFAQVVPISGPGGITSIEPPQLFSEPVSLYYAAVVVSVLTYVGFRALGRTNFGLALQGVRDDPVRMSSLGYNVPLHRTLAFTLGGFVAGIAGLISVWWRGQVDPASIDIGPTLILLIIAVIGGISYFEGAWLGAFVYVLLETYTGSVPLIDRIGLTPDRFNTVIGLIVLLIMVLSPEGLVGILERLRRGRGSATPAEHSVELPTTSTDAPQPGSATEGQTSATTAARTGSGREP